MLIACPTCATSYEVAATAIGANGRSVRCVRCQTLWVAMPQADEPAERIPEPVGAEDEAAAFRDALGGSPAAAPEEQPAPASEPPEADTAAPDDPASPDATDAATVEAPDQGRPPALSEIPIPVEDAPPLVPEQGDGMPRPADASIDNGPEDIESVAARRRARNAARRRRSKPRLGLPAVILVLIGLCTAVLALRKDIVRHVPQLASFYSSIGLGVNLRGLEFADVKVASETHDGVQVLVVEGMIVSAASVPVEVPRLRFALHSAAGAEVYAWTAQPSQKVLEPGETLPFRSRLASPPAEGAKIQVRFFTRRDVTSGMH